MADKNFKIGASIEVDNKQIKTEFTKAGELAGESVAKGLESKGGEIQEGMREQLDNIKQRLEGLKSFDFEINIDANNAEAVYNTLHEELIEANNAVVDFGDALREAGEDGGEVYKQLESTTDEYKQALIEAQNEVEKLAAKAYNGMDEAEEEIKETTEAVKELNEEADKGISENGGLGKMLKFLTSKEIFNFFYRNLKKIGEKLIELSGDGEMLAAKFEPVKQKLEAVGGYIGKGLTPAVESAVDEIDNMASELMKTGEDGKSSLGLVQQGVYWIGQAFLAVMNVIKQFGQYLGKEIADWTVLFSSFWKDIYDTAKSVITGIGNADNWTALGNNIKYGIVQGVNGAIESMNGLLGWMKDKLGVNLGKIGTINAGSKQSFDFGDIDFTRTKNALKDIARTNSDFISDITDEWQSFWNKAKDGANELKKTTIDTNRKIKEDTKKTIGGSGGGGKDSVKGAYEELEEEAMDVREELSSMVEDHQKSYDKLTEQIEKVREQYDKLRDEAKKTWEDAEKSLEEYNSKLEKAQAEAITDLGQRYVELQKDLMGIDETIKKEAEELSWSYIRRLQQSGVAEYEGFELKKLIDIKEKLEELQLIEENTTEEQRKQDEFLKETSKTQEIINKLKEQETELENKKAAAIEKQAIAQAMMAQEDGKQYIKTVEGKGTWYYDEATKKWEEIHDLDNIEYAKQLESQSMNLNDQLKQFQAEKDNEVEILIDTTARKIELENEFQKVFEENIKKQGEQIESLIQKEQRLIDKRREYLSMGGTLHNAYGGSVMSGQASVVGENGPETIIARQSSYVQPRNAGNSYNTVNNSNSLSINGIEIGNFNTIDDMLDALKERLTYRS